MNDTIDTLRAQLAEARRELVAKEAERAAMELERNNAQRQHTMQRAINKADSQRIPELTAQLAEAQREAVTLAQYLYNACYSHEPDYASGKVKWEPCDTPAGVITQIDNMVAGVRAKLAEAQRDSERLDWIEKIALRELPSPPRRGMWKFGDGLIVGMSLRAAIDAARGER